MFYGAILASDLADLVEMIYVLIRLMENLQARGALRVCQSSFRLENCFNGDYFKLLINHNDFQNMFKSNTGYLK